MSEKMDTKIGEFLPVLREAIGQIQTWTPKQAKEHLERRREIIQGMLTEGIDYWIVSGSEKKPRYALLKPGIEKLGRFAHFFGMPPVYAKYETVEEQIDDFKEWEYKKNVEGVIVTIQTRGYYRYRVRCTLYAFGSDEFAGSKEGVCSSIERGREDSNANTIWQMAAKRAASQAVRDYTCTSDILLDEETLTEARKDKDIQSESKKNNGIPKPLRSMNSKYGSKEKQSKCGFCGKYHILEGDPIVQHPIIKDDKDKNAWGAKKCYAATFNNTGSDTNPEQDEESEGGGDGNENGNSRSGSDPARSLADRIDEKVDNGNQAESQDKNPESEKPDTGDRVEQLMTRSKDWLIAKATGELALTFPDDLAEADKFLAGAVGKNKLKDANLISAKNNNGMLANLIVDLQELRANDV